MRPLSYWFDGGDRLYFLYITGGESRKADLSERADVARFLVYRADTRFQWRSVLLTGTVSRVPESEHAAVEEAMDLRRRPAALERASGGGETTSTRSRSTTRNPAPRPAARLRGRGRRGVTVPAGP